MVVGWVCVLILVGFIIECEFRGLLLLDWFVNFDVSVCLEINKLRKIVIEIISCFSLFIFMFILLSFFYRFLLECFNDGR